MSMCPKHPELEGARYANGACKACSKAAAVAWQKANPARCIASHAAYRATHAAETRAATKAWKAANTSYVRDKHKEWISANPEKNRAQSAAWYQANKDKALEAMAKAYAANPTKKRESSERWRKANLALANAQRAARTRRVRKSTPPWADRKAIRAIYAEAARLGLTVDHIVPLKGKLVSGLHVESNLQLLTKSDNCKKHVSFDLEAYEHAV